jgi:hypothetical protein
MNARIAHMGRECSYMSSLSYISGTLTHLTPLPLPIYINVTPMYMYIAQPCNYLTCRGYHSK